MGEETEIKDRRPPVRVLMPIPRTQFYPHRALESELGVMLDGLPRARYNARQSETYTRTWGMVGQSLNDLVVITLLC
jgi:hypothetical protein